MLSQIVIIETFGKYKWSEKLFCLKTSTILETAVDLHCQKSYLNPKVFAWSDHPKSDLVPNKNILCLTSRTTVTSARILEEDVLLFLIHATCVFSHTFKKEDRNKKGYALQDASVDTLSDVTVVLGMRQSIAKTDAMINTLNLNREGSMHYYN